MAPNLLTLLVEEQWYLLPPPSGDGIPDFPTLITDTKITRLQIPFFDRPEEDVTIDDDSALPLLDVLERCTQLQQLSLTYTGCDWVGDRLIEFFITHRTLLDLHWTNDSSGVNFNLDVGEVFPSVKRLVLESLKWSDMYQLVTDAPNIETICFLLRPDEDAKTIKPIEGIKLTTPFGMMPKFASDIRRCPYLHTIQTIERDPEESTGLEVFDLLDEVEAAGTRTGWIRSLHREGEELLHVHLLSDRLEVADEPCATPEPDYSDWSSLIIPYDAADGTRRQKVFVRLAEPIWQDYTDFDEAVVPMEIIREMLEVEGIDERDWMGRGLEVGELAWRVLVEWREKVGSGELPRSG